MITLLSESQLRDGVRRVADELTQEFGDRPILIVGVLTGCIVFMADLIRRLAMPVELALVSASSYRGDATYPGELKLNLELLPSLHDRDVVLIDDIFDTGKTLAALKLKLAGMNPRSLRTVVLLRKQGRQEVTQVPEHVAFEIPDKFVVGYGLDYDGRYRNLPHIAILEEDDLRSTTVCDPGEEPAA